MARRLSAAHKKAISMALRRVKGATTGLDEYQPKPRKPKAPKKPTRASSGSGKKTGAKKPTLKQKAAAVNAARKYDGSYDEGLHGPNAKKAPAKKTAAKKTATKKPAPAKTPAKKTAAKKPAAKKPTLRQKAAAVNAARKYDGSYDEGLHGPNAKKPVAPKKKTAATNRPTPKSESPSQARKADAEFKANREARRDSTPFGSIRNSMAEAQLINGRKSNRDRDEDLADAIQRDSKLTYAEQEAKRNAGTVAQLNAAKRRKAKLREKELEARGTSGGGSRKEQVQDLGARAKAARERAVMGGTGVKPNPRAEQDRARRRSDEYDLVEGPDGTAMPRAQAEAQQLSPGWVDRDDAPNMARAGDTVYGTGQSEFFKGEMKIVGDPYVEDDGHPYVEVSKRNGTVELARADMAGNVLDDDGTVVAVRVTEGGTKIRRTSSRGRGKSAKRSDAPDPRVSGFDVKGLFDID